jgi:mannose-6-phosphate isomerase
MSDLYPLKFETVLKEKVWGGDALVKRFNKEASANARIGESWEISSVSGNLSVVSNGFLAGNNIQELLEVYMGDIAGDTVYEKFGDEFPLLIKLIEAREDLSIQVHPGDKLAKERHNAYGKTEMWYILESEKDAKIYTGFKNGVTKEIYQEAIEKGTLPEILNVEISKPGDVFFTPAGRIHAIGAGNVLVEIQQTSDITYRIFDWNRKSTGKEKRELHTDLALDAIDFSVAGTGKTEVEMLDRVSKKLVECEYFNTNLLRLDNVLKKEYYLIDSFVIYICTEGEFILRWDGNHEQVRKGETILLPAMIKEVILEPAGKSELLEVYINEQSIS